jgi:hypothetical protein
LIAAGVGLLAFGWVAQACSSGSNVDASDAGSGADVAQEAAVDAGCDLSSNLLDQIPDAEIADGASTTGACVACLNSQCSQQVNSCNQLCTCKNATAKGLDCYLKNPAGATACLVAFTGAGIDLKVQTIGLGLLGCVQSKCKEGCATASFQKEAGTTEPDPDAGQ